MKNKEFVYIAASEQFAKMVGKESASEIVGKTDYEIFEESLAKKHRMEDDWKIVHEKNSVVNDVQFGFGKDIESFRKTRKLGIYFWLSALMTLKLRSREKKN